MALISGTNQPTRELTLSSRCVFNTQLIDSDTKEVVYSTRTPKVWFTRQSVTTLTRHDPPTNKPSGPNRGSPAIPQPASQSLLEKVPDPEDVSSESTVISPLLHHTSKEQELKREKGNGIEVTKIQWKFFHDTLFEHNFQTKDVNEIMEKTGRRPLRLYVDSLAVPPMLQITDSNKQRQDIQGERGQLQMGPRSRRI